MYFFFFQITDVALFEEEVEIEPRPPSPRYFGGVGPQDDHSQDFLYHLRKNTHEFYEAEIKHDRAEIQKQRPIKLDMPEPLPLPEPIEPPIKPFFTLQDTKEWFFPNNNEEFIDDFVVNRVLGRKMSGGGNSLSAQKRSKEKFRTCAKQERRRKNGHPHHFSSMTRQGFVDFDF